jgi:hypothetical protein
VEEGVSAREEGDSGEIGSEEGSGSMGGSGGVAAGLDSDETSLSACSSIDLGVG